MQSIYTLVKANPVSLPFIHQIYADMTFRVDGTINRTCDARI